MKQLRHVLALTLVFCMVFGMVTPSLAVSGEISVEEDYGIPVEEDGGIEIEVDDRSDYDIDEDREELSVLPKQDETADETNTTDKVDGYNYNIIHLDCGRKYFSVDSIKQIIDNASAAGFNYIQLAVGNDGMRFLLDDMNLTLDDGTEYDGTAITAAIKAANKAYYDAGTHNELTQSEMDEIIAYAYTKGMGVIPLINTPGHMDAILAAANKVTGTDCSYNSSVRTIDVTNPTAVAFTKAFLTKYITYFAGEGCTLFNMGADEYANDKYANENGMGFGVLQRSGQYGDFVSYVNDIAKAITKAGMRPMAFNDGIYYGGNTSSGTFDTNIIIEYWSSGWSGYTPMSASGLAAKGFKMVNTHGDYYWVLGKPTAQCSPEKARGFDKTVFPGSTISNPGGSTFCIWSDYPGAETEASVISKTADTIEAFGGTLPNLNPTVTVSVNQTVERTQDGVNNENNVDRSEFNKDIATVVVTGTDAVAGNVSYNSSRYYYSQITGENSSPTKTIYYYKVGDNYYPVYAYYRTSSYYGYRTNYYIGYSTTDSADNVEFVVNGETYNRRIELYTKSGTDPVPASTTIAITGKTVGTTYITVGGVRYTINVVAENLASKSITVEYWITNVKVNTLASDATEKTIYASDSTVYSENGALLSGLVPEKGKRNTQSDENLVFWKGTRLVSGSEQTTNSGDDKTGSGDDFKYIRYWDSKWSFSADGVKWKDFNTTDQIVAYYLQRTEVTDEINTEVVDWGEERSRYGYSNFVLMDYAVMYQSGERLPGTFPVANKTIAFHCDPNDTNTVKKYSETSTQWYNYYRQIGMIRGQETSDYEVYMITLTPTSTNKNTQVASYASSATSYTYDYSNEKVIWVDDIANLGDFADQSKWYTSVSGDAKYGFSEETSVGGMPIVPGVEITNRHGLLVTYYIRAKATTDSLTVHYMDRTNGNKEFYSYPINVNQGTTFKTGPYLPEIPEANGIPTHINNGDVVNSLGKTQYVSSVLATMPEISATYRYSSWTCEEVIRSDDGKDLYLYYTFKNTHSFVVDFGVPLHLTTNDIIIDGDWTSYTATQGKYGTVEYDGTKIGGGITYIPTKVMQGRDEIAVTLNPKNASDKPATHFIYLYPATNVLYEENVLTEAVSDKYQSWTHETSTTAKQQATEKLGGEAVHGYDAAYDNDKTFSADSYYHATLSETNKFTKNLTFTFTGTGFDVISECGPQTGMLVVAIKNSAGKTVKVAVADTLFNGDSKYITGTSGILDYQVPVYRNLGLEYDTYTVNIGSAYADNRPTDAASVASLHSNDTYSIVSDILDAFGYDDVNVEDVELVYMDENSVLNGGTGVVSEKAITAFSANLAEEYAVEPNAVSTEQNVYVDGVRIYGTLANDPGYATAEKDVKYDSVYDFAKNSAVDFDTEIGDACIYVEYDGDQDVYNIADYKQQGPENEVYLTPGSGIAFQLNGYTAGMTVQVSAKIIETVKGSKVSINTVKDNGEEVDALVGFKNGSTNFISSTEMYYNAHVLTKDGVNYVLIVNGPTSTGILSLSNVKVNKNITACVKPELIEIINSDSKAAFVPDTFKISYKKGMEEITEGDTIQVSASLSRKNKNNVITKGLFVDVINNATNEKVISHELLKATNTKAVQRGKTNIYSYNYALFTGGENDVITGLKQDTVYTFVFYAEDTNSNRSGELTFDVTVHKLPTTEN